MQVGVGLSKYSIESSTSLPVKTFNLKPLVQYRLTTTVLARQVDFEEVLVPVGQFIQQATVVAVTSKSVIMILEPRSCSTQFGSRWRNQITDIPLTDTTQEIRIYGTRIQVLVLCPSCDWVWGVSVLGLLPRWRLLLICQKASFIYLQGTTQLASYAPPGNKQAARERSCTSPDDESGVKQQEGIQCHVFPRLSTQLLQVVPPRGLMLVQRVTLPYLMLKCLSYY